MGQPILPAPGTISIAHNSATITGVGTIFQAYRKGYLIFSPGFGLVGQLASDPDDDFTATLVDNLGGAVDLAGATFQVFSGLGDAPSQAERVRQLVDMLSNNALGIPLIFDSSLVAADPGTGKFRLDDPVAPANLHISKTSAAGKDISGFVGALDDVLNAVSRASLSLRPLDGANAYLKLKVTGAIVDHGTWATVPIGIVAGAVPANKARLAVDSVAAGADGAISTVNSKTGAVVIKGSERIENLGLAFSVAASALTCAVKKADGATDAGATDPVLVGMRSATLASGSFNQRSITGALSLVVPSGATLGHSNGVAANLYWYLLDNAGALELAVSGTDQGRSGIFTTVAIDATADLATGIYSTAARANVPFRKIAKTIDTQVAAATWAAVPTETDLSPTSDDTKLSKSANLSDLAGPVATAQKNLGVREVLTADRTYFVRADGNDANTGLVDSAGGGFLTATKALSVAAALDCGIYNLTIQVRTGTFTAPIVLPRMIGSGNFTLIGDTATPGNVIINTTSASAITLASGETWTVRGFRLQTTTSGHGLDIGNGQVRFGDLVFGAIATCHMSVVGSTARAIRIGNYSISGNAQIHLACQNGGYVYNGLGTFTFTQNVTFSVATVYMALAQSWTSGAPPGLSALLP